MNVLLKVVFLDQDTDEMLSLTHLYGQMVVKNGIQTK